MDLDAHGILAAPEKAADFEVLLEPFEQQQPAPAKAGVPTLFVEPGDLGGRPLEVVGQQLERLVLVRAGDGDLAQDNLKERVLGRPATRLAMADLDPASGLDGIAPSGVDGIAPSGVVGDHATMGVALAPGDKKRPGGADLKPPAVIGAALVEDQGGAGFDRHGAAGDNVLDLGRGQLEPDRPALPRVIEQMQFPPAGAGAGLGPSQALVPLFKPGAGLSGIGVASSSRITASLWPLSAPAATGASALASAPNTAAGRPRLASAKVERHGARRLRW